ncbi:MAG: DUF885 domain-containing protein [Acidimicrobiales bacterium]
MNEATGQGRPEGPGGGGARQQYLQAAQAAVEELLRSQPEWATSLGDHRFDHEIDDLSEDGLAETSRHLGSHRATLGSIDPTLLGPEDRVDLEMLVGELESRVFVINDLASFRWDPLVYNVGEALYPLLTREVLPLPDRLRAIASRLDQVPGRLAAARRQVEAPPRAHVETALRRHPGNVAMVREEVGRLAQGEPGLRSEVEAAQEAALGSLGEFEGVLRAWLAGPHRPERIGHDLFARRLRLELASDMSPEQVLDRARQHLEAVAEELGAAARGYLGSPGAGGGADRSWGGDRPGTVRAALDQVAREHPDDRTIVQAINDALARCTDTVRSLGIVSLPDQPMRVELMPVFRRGIGGAYCDPAGPLEEGGETSFAVEPTPEEWSAEEKESFYREYNSAMVTDLTVHEAMPGHMVQLAHARTFRGSTAARLVLGSGSFIEGWAVHAERIMAEHGHGGLPVRLQQLKMLLRSVINAILDVSFHAGDLDEAGAMELMTSTGYQEHGEARKKWTRLQLTSAQLSTYFVGYCELADVFARLGEGLSYDEVLAHGSPPPRLLGQLLSPG